MNAWMTAACVLLPAGVGPCLLRAFRGHPAERLAGMSMVGMLAVAVFLLVARGVHRSSYVDVALVMVVLTPAGTLVFARGLAGGTGRRPGDWRGLGERGPRERGSGGAD
ncbi:monovalent cation/H+ antiporter complex subunit F [Streptomyces sp. NBC_01190]|uniref:monovalent cation/H+ antiporter complex subunit F n=1 Tax=Streptomyces sp. NBC_01190 TaxID=2903767 RepID=UPI0038682759|nr:monovalent cation/H+ antiporter complex subunit F [Streptomyces sp. NBC_01190]